MFGCNMLFTVLDRFVTGNYLTYWTAVNIRQILNISKYWTDTEYQQMLDRYWTAVNIGQVLNITKYWTDTEYQQILDSSKYWTYTGHQ